MNTLKTDEVSNLKLMMDIYIQSIHADLDKAELDGEMLMKVLTMTTNLTMLNAMALADLNEEKDMTPNNKQKVKQLQKDRKKENSQSKKDELLDKIIEMLVESL
jgi:hypothetical protein